jgi:uncharacterized membrane protein
MFLLTASAQIGQAPSESHCRVAPLFAKPALLVTLTGIAELAGGIALQIQKLAFLAAAGLFLLLIALFPANICAAKHRLAIGGRADAGRN